MNLSSLKFFVVSTMLIGASALMAQNPQQPIPLDPNAPTLTLEEKITLTTDELKKQDVLERAQKAFQEQIKPIQDHQDAAKVAIQNTHPGWLLDFNNVQGWHFIKKVEPAKQQEVKPAMAKDEKKK